MKRLIFLFLFFCLSNLQAELLDDLRYFSINVPKTLENAKGDPAELYQQVIEKMTLGLTPHELIVFNQIEKEITHAEANTFYGYFHGGSEVLKVFFPKEFKNSPIEYFIRIHELGHALLNVKTGRHFMGNFYETTSSLGAVKLGRFNEDHSYRWEKLYLSSLSEEAIKGMLEKIKAADVPEYARKHFLRMFGSHAMPLNKYLKQERNSARYVPSPEYKRQLQRTLWVRLPQAALFGGLCYMAFRNFVK